MLGMLALYGPVNLAAAKGLLRRRDTSAPVGGHDHFRARIFRSTPCRSATRAAGHPSPEANAHSRACQQSRSYRRRPCSRPSDAADAEARGQTVSRAAPRRRSSDSPFRTRRMNSGLPSVSDLACMSPPSPSRRRPELPEWRCARPTSRTAGRTHHRFFLVLIAYPAKLLRMGSRFSLKVSIQQPVLRLVPTMHASAAPGSRTDRWHA